ncbi:MAG: hypothetical protein KF897_11440 [Opitutaceae bacterium]|nr:hypothetical protein [Opitutaceae bacterium]
MTTPSAHPPPARRYQHLLMMACLALLSLGLSWHWMRSLSAEDPWYRNTDMNIHTIADALCLNSGFAPGVVAHPAAPSRYLLALDFRLRNEFGLLPVWTLKRFARSAEPLRELTRLVHVGREHSRLLVIAFMLVAAAFVRSVTGRFDLACLAIVAFGGSAGLLFHGLLLRPELLCAGFGLIALHLAWLAMATPRPASRALWLLLAGVAAGLALLSKLPGLLCLGFAGVWCLLAPLLPKLPGREDPARRSAPGWGAALCLAAGLAVLTLLLLPVSGRALLDPAGAARLRPAVLFVTLAPLLHFLGAQRPVPRFLVDRAHDLALLVAGMLVALTGWFALLRLVMAPDQAADYMAKILNTVCYPDTWMEIYTHPGAAHRLQELWRFILDAPLLFALGAAFTLGLAFMSRIPARWRALQLLLLAQALTFALVMGSREFLEQYSVFTQTPLLLIWPVGVAALTSLASLPADAPGNDWPAALAGTAALFLSLTVVLSLGPKYRSFQDDATLPVRDLTITFLYDHDMHPPAYLKAMKQRYPTRVDFRAALDHHLADPANRR